MKHGMNATKQWVKMEVIANNDIKHRESECFNEYLNGMDRCDRAEFIKYLAHECGVSRPVVYSWKYMCCRIPEHAKRVIEAYAGEKIFTNEYDYDTEKA